MNQKANWILILAVVALGIFALMPEKKQEQEEVEDRKVTVDKQEVISNAVSGEPNVAVSLSRPDPSIFHKYFPLVKGSRWIYKVRGPEHVVPAKTWTLELVEMPVGKKPGVVRAGFGEDLKEGKIWLDDGSIRLDILPYTEPIEYLGSLPSKVDGMFLSHAEAFVSGSMWEAKYERQVMHEYTEGRNIVKKGKAKIVQTDRVEVAKFEKARVLSRKLDAVRLEWSSSMRLTMEDRPLLARRTTEVFRKETMWLVPGVGIVERRIVYPYGGSNMVTLNLIQYIRPNTPSN